MPRPHHVLPLSLLTAATGPLLLAISAAAQTAKVLPPSVAARDGSFETNEPLGANAFRHQHLIRGDNFCVSSAMLSAFAYRRDGAHPSTFTSLTLRGLIVTIGHAATTPASMSNVFAANRAGTQTVIHRGDFVLPTQPPAAIGPFNIRWPAATPFAYARASGDLLLELEVPGSAGRFDPYVIDVEYPNGLCRAVGAAGAFQSGRPHTLSCSLASVLRPGGILQLQASSFLANHPAVLWVGASATAMGSLRLPFDLGVLGAPGNTLYASMDVVAPFPLTPLRTVFFGYALVPIPSDPRLVNATVHVQAAYQDAPSNALGVVTSNALDVVLGGDPAQHGNMLYAHDTASAKGLFLLGSFGPAAPVVQLQGVFQ